MQRKQGPLRCATAWSLLQRLTGVASCALALVVSATSAGAAQAGCDTSGRALGVSRIVEIDTTSGPHFGQQQFPEADFLRPGEIVLTFDDGPLRPHTQPILNALEAQCTKATFFMVGSQAIADPEMVRRVIAKGHTVGNHTWSHANLQKSASVNSRREIELGLSAITAAAGQPVAPFFRFPYLAQTKSMQGYAQMRGLGVFSIDVDSQDWKTKNAASVKRDVLRQLADLGRGIILFHDIQPATAQALPDLLETLRVKGYHVVQLKPKAMATTLPEFDAMARNANQRNQVALAAQPLAKRRMTWGSADPTVLGPPSLPPRHNASGPGSGQIAGPFAPPAALSTPPLPIGTPAQPQPRIARPDTNQANDWRDKFYGR